MLFVLRFVLFLCLSLPALAQDLRRGPAPDWVEDLALPADDPAMRAEARDGLHYILSDYQVAFDGPASLAHARTVLEVTDRAGLEKAAAISIDFDPTYDKVTLTRLIIRRGGREIDLRASLPDQVFRREPRLDEGIVDGTLTAWLRIADLRVGDTVDYATLREATQVARPDERAVFAVMEWNVPVVLTRAVVLWPEGVPMTQGALPDRVLHVQGPGPAGTTRHEWRRERHVPPPVEEAVPAMDEPTAYLRLSGDADWGALSASLTPWYAADYPLTPEWETRLSAIASAHPDDPEARVLAALRLVQDGLRFGSDAVGKGAVFARAPAEVIASGYGDCKDKALLLAVMLRRMGISAQVALTDIDNGAGLPAEVPMSGVFDHAIVRLKVDGQVHWLDPTFTHQGGSFATMAPPPYAWALPLAGAGQTALEPIPEPAETAWWTDVTETYRFTFAGVFLTVRTVAHGGAADYQRERWATTPRRQITQAYLDYYLNRYPGLTLQADIAVQDDRAANLVTLEERYFLPRGALTQDGLDQEFPFAAEDFASNLPQVAGPRTLPLDSGRAALFHHVVEVKSAGFDFDLPEPVHIRNAAFAYDFAARAPRTGEMVLEWTHRRSGRPLPAAEVAAVLRDAWAVHDTTWLFWNVQPD